MRRFDDFLTIKILKANIKIEIFNASDVRYAIRKVAKRSVVLILQFSSCIARSHEDGLTSCRMLVSSVEPIWHACRFFIYSVFFVFICTILQFNIMTTRGNPISWWIMIVLFISSNNRITFVKLDARCATVPFLYTVKCKPCFYCLKRMSFVEKDCFSTLSWY